MTVNVYFEYASSRLLQNNKEHSTSSCLEESSKTHSKESACLLLLDSMEYVFKRTQKY